MMIQKETPMPKLTTDEYPGFFGDGKAMHRVWFDRDQGRFNTEQ